ncbi:MAG TPA: T9SS type A sorting domain-containing protein [Candidatus Kryptonia bacterium]
MLSHRTYLLTVLVVVWCIALPSATAQYVQEGSKLVGTGAVGTAHQGGSVSLSADGNTAIVGGLCDSSYAGAAWVYTRSGGVWSQQGSKLVGTGADGSACQGYSVSLSADGNTAIVGGYGDNSGAGAAWVYTRSGGVWSQQGSKLVGTGAVGSAQQGYSVSLSADGNTAIVGGLGDNSGLGAAWVFTRSGGVWSQQGSKLVGTGAVGSALQGALQGGSVSLSADGNTAIVGGYDDNGDAGAAWVYTRSGGVWSQQGTKLVGTGAIGSAQQGYSVSLSADGNTAIVGGPSDNSSAWGGAVWVYTRSGGVWSQQGGKLVGTGAVGGACQGWSVSLSADGNTAIVGGYWDNSGAGAAWVWVNGAPNIVGVKDVGNDQGGRVRISWGRSLADSAVSAHQIVTYGLWRRIPALQSGLGKRGEPGPLNDTLGILYDFITSVPAVQSPQYNVVASTYEDSTSTGTHCCTFLVTAHTSDPNVFFISNEDSGYSVDNIPPDPPSSVSGNVVSGAVDMSWKKNKEPDMWRYAIYRSTSPIDEPYELTALATTTDTVFADTHPITGDRSYYAVCAQDIHGNLSGGGNQLSFIPSDFSLSVSLTAFTASTQDYGVRLDWKTGSETNNAGFIVMREMQGETAFKEIASYTSDVALKGLGTSTDGKSYSYTDNSLQTAGKYTYELENVTTDGVKHTYNEITVDVSTPTDFALFQNYPNPFNPSTTIAFNLKEQSEVTLTIYNVLGQDVATYSYGTMGGGRYQEEINLERLTSGVYYYRLDATGTDGKRFTSIKKLLELK